MHSLVRVVQGSVSCFAPRSEHSPRFAARPSSDPGIPPRGPACAAWRRWWPTARWTRDCNQASSSGSARCPTAVGSRLGGCSGREMRSAIVVGARVGRGMRSAGTGWGVGLQSEMEWAARLTSGLARTSLCRREVTLAHLSVETSGAKRVQLPVFPAVSLISIRRPAIPVIYIRFPAVPSYLYPVSVLSLPPINLPTVPPAGLVARRGSGQPHQHNRRPVCRRHPFQAHRLLGRRGAAARSDPDGAALADLGIDRPTAAVCGAQPWRARRTRLAATQAVKGRIAMRDARGDGES